MSRQMRTQTRNAPFDFELDKANVKQAKHEPRIDQFTDSLTSNIAPTKHQSDPRSSELQSNNAESVETGYTGSTKTTQSDDGSARSERHVRPRAPIKTLFTPRKFNVEVPQPDPAWGTTPYPGPDGPQPRPDLPPARSSNAQTIPPLFEDRKFKFKPGRYHKTLGDYYVQVEAGEDMPMLDQEDNLMIPLMDMRPVDDNNREPRRQPFIYVYENGAPVDWHDSETLKALNDRRREAISRITNEAPWTELEREYLAELCKDYPDASILEYGERFNFRFKGDFKEKTAFSFHEHHTGRTLESIRHEYLSFKPLYVEGQVPNPRRQGKDKTRQIRLKNITIDGPLEKLEAKFGPKNYLNTHNKKQKSETIINDSDTEPDTYLLQLKRSKSKGSRLTDLEEELLHLGGYYDDTDNDSPVRYVTKKLPSLGQTINVPEHNAWMLESDDESLSNAESVQSGALTRSDLDSDLLDERFEDLDLSDDNQSGYSMWGTNETSSHPDHLQNGLLEAMDTIVSQYVQIGADHIANLRLFAD